MSSFIHPGYLEPDGASRPTREILQSKRGLSASLPEVLGAVGISILVLGLAGFGIGAGINFAQDSGARSTLESVSAAEILHQTKTGDFGTLDDLVAGDSPALTSKPDNIRLFLTDDRRDYCAAVESGSMGRNQFVIGARGGVVELRTHVEHDQIKGCQSPGMTVLMQKHATDLVGTSMVPFGSQRSCLRFAFDPGPSVSQWYIHAVFRDAAMEPVVNSKTGQKTTAAARAADVDGFCFPLGSEVKNVSWYVASNASWNTLGSTYRDLAVIYQ